MRWQATFDRLDAISRTRALTDKESAMMQHAIEQIDHAKRPVDPSPWKRSAWTPEQDARFFDAIADGVTITLAAELVGRSRNAGVGRFDRACKQLGWQAS